MDLRMEFSKARPGEFKTWFTMDGTPPRVEEPLRSRRDAFFSSSSLACLWWITTSREANFSVECGKNLIVEALACKFHNLSVRSLVSICRRFDCGNKSPESLIGSRFVTRRGFHPGSRTLEVLTLAN